MNKEINVELPENIKERVDKYIASIGLLTRAQIKTRNLKASIKGKEIKLSFNVRQGDLLELQWEDEIPMTLEPEEMELDILYEDSNVLVLNKPQGLVVHPAAGNWTGTLVQGLLYYLKPEKINQQDIRPGIVHRLDKDTSGVIITAKHTDAKEELSSHFRDRETEKIYMAVVKGRPPQMKGEVEGYISRDPHNRKKFILHKNKGKWSRSIYRVKKIWRGYSLVQIQIETGRTHQIRVHMKSLGCPVLGDPVYGRKDPDFPEVSLKLHSFSLAIALPGAEELSTFTAPLPEPFTQLLDSLDQSFSL